MKKNKITNPELEKQKLLSEEFLNNLTNKYDKELGLNGNYSVVFKSADGIEFGILNLTKKVAKQIFDLFDISNFSNHLLEITLKHGSKKIDYTMIPNSFSNKM